MNYFISNAPNDRGSNSNAGTAVECPWLDFSPIHQRSLRPGDRILLRRGSCWNQQLTIYDSGEKGFGGCAIDAYGAGPLPKIIRNGDAMERCIVLHNPSFWRISHLEVGCAGVCILARYDTAGHESLNFDHIVVHDCYGIFDRDMLDGPAKIQSKLDKVGISAGILVTGGNLELEEDQYMLRGIRFDHIEGYHNADTVAIRAGNITSKGAEAYAYYDITLNHLYFHDDDAPNPGGIPDTLSFVSCKHVMLLNSRLDNECGRYTTSGTAAVFLGGVKDLYFLNNIFTRTPDTLSFDQCAIDFEATTRQVKIRNNYFGQHAGPGIEFLDIWGEKSFSENHEVTGNAFEGNGWGSHGGQAGSGGIHHCGGNFATGIIRDNVAFEPGRPLLHGEFTNFQLINNLQASRPLANSMAGFSATQGENGWRYQLRQADGSLIDLPFYDAERQVWTQSADDAVVWISRFEQLAAEGSCAAVRSWTAPSDGNVAIRSRVIRSNGKNSPMPAQITLNGAVIWGPPTEADPERAGYEAHLDNLAVAAGDVLRFEVAGPSRDLADGISWAQTIAYIG
ncbi:MAG: hypothetical protein ACYCZF_07875 [Anaerolineae bacterium]